MIDILKTMKYLIPDIHAVVWCAPNSNYPPGYDINGNIDTIYIKYDDTETRRITLSAILSADQSLVNTLNWRDSRIAAYLAKGWNDEWGFSDDLMNRGFDAVMQDRKAIKEKFPKI